jgi:hypothetical protein
MWLADATVADREAEYWVGELSKIDDTYAAKLARERLENVRRHGMQVALLAEERERLRQERSSGSFLFRFRSILRSFRRPS